MKKYTIKKLTIGVLSVGLIFSGLSLNSFDNIFAKNISASATANSKNVKIEVFEVDGKVEFKFTALKNLENVEIKTTVDGETKVYKYKELKKGQETTEKQPLKTEKEILEERKNQEKLEESKQKSGSKTLPKTAPASNLEEVVEKLNANFGIHKVDIELKYYIEKTVNEELEKSLTSSLDNNTNNITSDQQDKEARFRELSKKFDLENKREELLRSVFFENELREDTEFWEFLKLGFDLNKGEDFKKAIITYVNAFFTKGPVYRYTKEHIIYYHKAIKSSNGNFKEIIESKYAKILKLAKNNEGFYEREKAFELELKKLNEKFASADGRVAKLKILDEQLDAIDKFQFTYAVDEENINNKIEKDKIEIENKYERLYEDISKKRRELWDLVYQDDKRVWKEFKEKETSFWEKHRKLEAIRKNYDNLDLYGKKDYLERKIKLLSEKPRFPELKDTKDSLYTFSGYAMMIEYTYNKELENGTPSPAYLERITKQLEDVKKAIEAQERGEISEPSPTEPTTETTN